MIRATDDVEKVRLFIGQGLLATRGRSHSAHGYDHYFVQHQHHAGMDGDADIAGGAGDVHVLWLSSASRCSRRYSKNFPHFNTVLQENLAGVKVIKAFTREKEQQTKFRIAADDTMNQAITVARLFTFLFPLVFMIANLGQAAILYVGGKQIITGLLTLGEWQEFSLYLIYLFFPIATVRIHHHATRAGLCIG